MGEESFTINDFGALNIHMGKMNFDPYFISYIKIDSKWIIDLNPEVNIIRCLEENKIKILVTL